MNPGIFIKHLGRALLLACNLVPIALSQSPPDPLPPAASPSVPLAIALRASWSSSEPFLTAQTAVELRFGTPMTGSPIDAAEVDIASGRAPLTVTPELKGAWTWRSPRSGVFVPQEEPVRGRTYTFSLRPGLRDVSGQPLPVDQPTLALKVPTLQLIGRHPNWFPPQDAPRSPRLFLQFNDKINAAAAGRAIHFASATGTRAPATVRAATWGDLREGGDVSMPFRQEALKVGDISQDGTSLAADRVLPATLVVAPVQPLPVGNGWDLVIPEIVSTDGQSRLERQEKVRVGDVVPLLVAYGSALNEVGQPKSLFLRFNRELAESVSKEDIRRHLVLDPEPPAWTMEAEKDWVQITGTFDLQKSYKLTLSPGLSAHDGLAMVAPFAQSFEFKLNHPVVALPAYGASQVASGRGLFDVHTINMKGVKVRVKLADRESLIYALRAYRHYLDPKRGEESDNTMDDEGGPARIPFDAMPGQKIFEKEFAGTAALDAQDEFGVDWRQALNGRPSGALFITVEGEARPEWTGTKRRFGAQAFIQLTDIGLAWKLSPEEAFVLAFSHATGKPMEGVSLTAYDDEKNELVRTATSADGTARLPRGGMSWLLAEAGSDMHAVEFNSGSSEGLGMWRFGIPYDWDPPTGPRPVVSMFTERPVYQPGHTVFFKAIARVLDDDGGMKRPPANQSAELRAYDSKGRLFHRRQITLSAMGALDGSLELPAGPLGQYRLDLEYPKMPKAPESGTQDDSTADEEEGNLEESDEAEDESGGRPGARVTSTSFLVEDYRPNTFQIAFDDSSFKVDGDKARISLQASYLLGKPLSKARMAWTTTVGAAEFHADAFPDFAFLDSRMGYYWNEEGYHEVPSDLGGPGEQAPMVTGQARTDLSDQGRATLDFGMPQAAFAHRPRRVDVSAEVTDLNQQTIVERWQRTLHSSDFYLGIHRMDDLASIGVAVPVPLVAVRSDGQSWPEAVEAQVSVERIDFVSVRVQTVGGGSNVKSQIQREVVAQGPVQVQRQSGDTKPFSWVPRQPGYYQITARAKDAQGRQIESTTSLQVYGEGWARWQDRDSVQIDLAPDKTSYVEGETAKILVKSPVLGRACVTLEVRKVLRHFFVELTSNAQVIEVPVEPSMAPNVFVSVMVVRGTEASPRQHKSPDYRVGFAELPVMDARSRLVVAVASGQPDYRPGDQGTASVVVKDARGAPVEGAEVTFWAADDGVLTLRSYAPPDLWGTFHQRQPLAVVTGTSLMGLLAEDPAELAFTNKGYMVGGGEGIGGPGQERLRRNFQPVAFFQGVLTTGADGSLSVPFVVPDNLTRFRLIAVAAAGEDAFGTGTGSFEVNKPLMLEPSLPRFANVGDKITAKAILLNHTDHACEAQVTLTLDNLSSSPQPLVRKVSLAARGAAAVNFPLEIIDAGSARWQWQADSITPGVMLSDRVESTLPVTFAQPLLREMHYARIPEEGRTQNLLAAANPEILGGRGHVTITASNSALVEASGALTFLLRYPYGCAEQTTSSTLPWLAMHSFGEAVPGSKYTPEQVQSAIQKGASRLLSMQTGSGGLGYWPGDATPQMWTSAYGGMALALARDAGAVLPRERLTQLASFLSHELRRSGEAEDAAVLYEACFACYTLALLGQPEPAYHEILAAKHARLPHSARALLAMAMVQSGGDRESAATLMNQPLIPQYEAWATHYFPADFTAQSLMAWLKIDPVHPKTGELMNRLLKERSSGGDWGSTFTNAWALLALAADVQSAPATHAATTLSIDLDGQTTLLSIPASPSTKSITLPFEGQASATSTLTVSGANASHIRLVMTVEARPAVVPVGPRQQGFSITRTYRKVGPDGSTGPADGLEVGDLVAVSLEVEAPADARYVAVDDPLPSILEAVNPRFRSQAPAVPSTTPRGQDPYFHWWSDHEELRFDRALFFCNHLWSTGTYRLNYLARVVAEGVVTAPPSKIEAMYDPGRYGLSGTQLLSAKQAGDKVAGKDR